MLGLVLAVTATLWAQVSAQCKCDVLFVIDMSQSVQVQFKPEQKYTDEIIDSLDLGPGGAHMVGVMAFSSHYKQVIVSPWGQDKGSDELKESIDKIDYYGGMTFVSKALKFAKSTFLDSGRRPGTNLAVVLIHDGISYDVGTQIAQEIRGQPNVGIFAAGMNPKLTFRPMLEEMCGKPHHVFVGPDTAPQLIQAMRYLTHCEGTTAAPVTTTPAPRTTTTTARPATRPPATQPPATQPPATRPPTPGPTPIRAQSTQPTTRPPTTVTERANVGPGHCIFDLLIVLDTSNSVEGKVFEHEIERANKIVSRFKISESDTRVGFVEFAGPGTADTVFPLNKYFSEPTIHEGITTAKFISGTTAAGDALRLAYKELDPSRGARPGVAEQVVLFISDGISQQSVDTAAVELKTRAQRIYCIATDKFYNRETLKKIASSELLWYHIHDEPDRVRLETDLDLLTSACIK